MPQTQLSNRLTSLDAEFLYLEKKEAPLHVGSTVILDGEISFEELKALVKAKLPLLPRYQQKVIPAPFNVGHPTWEYDSDFDINRHIFHLRLEPPGTLEQLRILSNQILSRILDRRKPLWELFVVDGLEGNRSALITKVHHAMVDGVSGVELMNITFDLSPNPPPPPKLDPVTPPPPHPYSILGSYLDGLLDNLEERARSWTNAQLGLLDLIEGLIKEPERPMFQAASDTLASLASPVSPMPFNKHLSGQRDLSWCILSFDEVRAVRKTLGGTLNDVVLTGVARAVSRYLQEHGEKTTGSFLRMMVPVNMRRDEQHPTPGNKVSVLPVEIPMDVADLRELFTYVTKKTAELKEGRIAEEANLLATLLGTVPASIQALVGSLADTPVPFYNLVCTNVPGPQAILYVLGKKMTHFYPYVPIAYSTGLTCALLSYDKKLFFTLTGDAKLLPDLEQKFKPILEQSFAELRALSAG